MREIECDICGRPAIGEAFVEGARVRVCSQCARHGRMIAQPTPTPSKTLAPKPLAPELELVEDYGKTIRKAREARGLSLEQLGQQLGIRAQEIQHMEEGKLRPPEKDCRKLEAFLKIKLLVPAEAGQTPEELAKKLSEMKGKSRGEVTLADMVEIKVKKS